MLRFLGSVLIAGCAIGFAGIFLIQQLPATAENLGRVFGIGFGMSLIAALVAVPWRAGQRRKTERPFKSAALIVTILGVGFLLDQMLN